MTNDQLVAKISERMTDRIMDVIALKVAPGYKPEIEDWACAIAFALAEEIVDIRKLTGTS